MAHYRYSSMNIHFPKLTKEQKVARAESLLGHFIGNGSIYLHKVIGYGSFGVVIHAYGPRNERTGRFKEYAVKCMCKLMSIKEHILAADEIRYHKEISGHPNILPYIEILQDDLWFYLVLEYCPGGDLFKEIVCKRTYYGDDALTKKVFVQILNAVEYCHSKSVYHRDLKPENCLVKDNGRTVLLMDFGLATNKKRCHEWGCGSRFYMAPEVYGVNREPYCAAAADVWALGVILVNLVTGRNPWHKAVEGDSVYDNFCRDPNALQNILPISPELNHLLRRIFVEPKLRPSIPEIRKDVLKIDRFLRVDSPALEIWQEALDRDRHALVKEKKKKPVAIVKNQKIELHAEPLLPPLEKEYANPPAPNPAKSPSDKKAARRNDNDTLDTPVFDWRREVAALYEDLENPAQYEDAAPSWSSGSSRRRSRALLRQARAARDSASTNSQPFPVTPQMQTGFAQPAVAGDLSPSQFRRRSIRRRLFTRSSDLDMDEFPLETSPIKIVVDNIIHDEPELSQPLTFGQKVKQMMHRSARVLNSRGGGHSGLLEPID